MFQEAVHRQPGSDSELQEDYYIPVIHSELSKDGAVQAGHFEKAEFYSVMH